MRVHRLALFVLFVFLCTSFAAAQTTSLQSTKDLQPELSLPRLCHDNGDCLAASQFCNKRPGRCYAAGRCETIPQLCALNYAPVCGCDGVTYSNSCAAGAAGVSIDHAGACEQDACCDPLEEPGQFGNPICIEGHDCCGDGEWQCNGAGANSTCESPGRACEQCCDAAAEPGVNGNPFCFEGATCCADGTWQCNDGTAGSTCDADGIACEQCCNPLEEPGFGDNPTCFEGATCCSSGRWQCNDGTGESTCPLDGAECSGQCCDPADEPGQYGNPICIEGSTCCSSGKWECNDAGGTSTCEIDGVACEFCCDASGQPGLNGTPPCFEGSTCCATGDWQCNDAGAESTCGLDGITCDDCCDPNAEPGTHGNPFCIEGHSCCSDGTWQCNDAGGEPSCDVEGGACECCDPQQEPGHYGNPICFEGHSCCGNGEWQCNDAGAVSTCDTEGESCGQVCGGIAGLPCPDGEFCKTDFGECCCDFLGTCVPVPLGCPDIFLPVCGCDGVTYGNECEADAAGVSVEHPGACEGACCLPNGNCLDNLSPSYCENIAGGTFQGAGTDCLYQQCPVPDGKCCLPDGTCIETDQPTCEGQCGIFAGVGTECSPSTGVGGTTSGSESVGGGNQTPSPDPQPHPTCQAARTGACCLGDDTCVETHGECECNALGGTYNGDGSDCSNTFCGQTCSAEIDQTLMILHPDVVDDPVRTTCSGPNPADCGPWSFAAIASAVAGTTDPQELSTFVTDLFGHFDTTQTVNTFDVNPRPNVNDDVMDPWIAASGGGPQLDFSIAPFRLLAIVNRPDLRNDDISMEKIKAGEGRFVFGVLPGGGFSTVFTIIFEFKLPGDDCLDVRGWQTQWAALSEFEDFGPGYRAALQGITDQFATIGADPTAPNGSALAQFRTNEFLQPVNPWELREWRLLCPGDSECSEGGDGVCTDTGVLLTESTVEQTPDAGLNNSAHLADYMNENAAEILAGNYRTPCSFQGGQPTEVPFRAGASPVNLQFNAPGVPADVRQKFATNTCSGCHQVETGTNFQHIQERQAGQQSSLSQFLIDDLGLRLIDLCDNILLQSCGDGVTAADEASITDVLPELAGRAH